MGTKDIIDAERAKEFLQNPPAGMIPYNNFTDEQYEQIGEFLGGLGTDFQ